MGSRETPALPHLGGTLQARLLAASLLSSARASREAVSQGIWGPVSFLCPPGTTMWAAASGEDAGRMSRETSTTWQALPGSQATARPVSERGRLPRADAAGAQR